MALPGTIRKQLLYRKIMRIVLRLGRLSIIGSDTLSLERACFHMCAESMRIGCLVAAACECAVKILPIIKLWVCGDKLRVEYAIVQFVVRRTRPGDGYLQICCALLVT